MKLIVGFFRSIIFSSSYSSKLIEDNQGMDQTIFLLTTRFPIYLSICLFIYPSIYYIYLSIYLSIFLIYLTIFLAFYQFIYYIYLSNCLSIYISIHLSIYLSVSPVGRRAAPAPAPRWTLTAERPGIGLSANLK